MRYISFERRATGRRSWGALVGERVVDAPALGVWRERAAPTTLLAFIAEGRDAWDAVSAGVVELTSHPETAPDALTLDEIRLLAPLPRPAKNIVAVGENYADHIEESLYAEAPPEVPIYFSKAATSVSGPDDAVVADPRVTKALDWEAELGVVIGAGGRWIPRERALEHVFGYTVLNDLSARDQQHGRPRHQWFLGKSIDGYCPMGPVLVTADEIPDPQRLEISLRVNGVEKQHANTRHMIFSVAALIADLSQYMTLEPGDVLASGTPKGVGDARKPPEFLHPGDVVEAEITGIGLLRTYIVAPATRDD